MRQLVTRCNNGVAVRVHQCPGVCGLLLLLLVVLRRERHETATRARRSGGWGGGEVDAGVSRINQRRNVVAVNSLTLFDIDMPTWYCQFDSEIPIYYSTIIIIPTLM